MAATDKPEYRARPKRKAAEACLDFFVTGTLARYQGPLAEIEEEQLDVDLIQAQACDPDVNSR